MINYYYNHKRNFSRIDVLQDKIIPNFFQKKIFYQQYDIRYTQDL
jgi:hypothetical protein